MNFWRRLSRQLEFESSEQELQIGFGLGVASENDVGCGQMDIEHLQCSELLED